VNDAALSRTCTLGEEFLRRLRRDASHSMNEHPGHDTYSKLDVLGPWQLSPAPVDDGVAQLAQAVKTFKLTLVIGNRVDVEHCAEPPQERRIVQSVERLDYALTLTWRERLWHLLVQQRPHGLEFLLREHVFDGRRVRIELDRLPQCVNLCE
jgi:hypothetical protein